MDAIAISSESFGTVGPQNSTPPGNVSAITVTGFINPITNTFTLTVGVTPPGSLGTFIGCHLYLEMPDQSAVPPFVVGSTPLGGSAGLTGNWTVLDLGVLPYVAAQQPWTVTGPAPANIDATKNIPCRLYAASVSTAIDNPLVQQGMSGATPNQAFTLDSLASGSPTAGTNITTLTDGDGNLIAIVATVLAPQNITGKLETPVLVDVTGTPAKTPGWAARLVLTLGSADPTQKANWQPVGSVFTEAGPVYAPPGDGVSIPHSFLLDTPANFVTATVWLQAGLKNSSGGGYSWNNIVPGITPSFPITYGSTTGTTDATAIMTATIDASMAITVAGFGVGVAGIDNTRLQALCVEAANLAAAAVGSTNLQAGAVTSASIANAAVGNAAIANLAVASAQIISGTILGANIASATIAGANIGTATIAQANMANASIGTAQIQNLAVTDALISSCSIGKLTAGSANFTGTATFANGSNVVTISSTAVSLSNGSQEVQVNSSGLTLTGGSGFGISINTSGQATFTASSGSTTVNGNAVTTTTLTCFSLNVLSSVSLPTGTSSATAGSITPPSQVAGYFELNIAGSPFKIPYYNV